jgi:hypothetical protein
MTTTTRTTRCRHGEDINATKLLRNVERPAFTSTSEHIICGGVNVEPMNALRHPSASHAVSSRPSSATGCGRTIGMQVPRTRSASRAARARRATGRPRAAG